MGIEGFYYEKEINIISDQLLLEAIKTNPLTPKESEFTLLAHNISFPYNPYNSQNTYKDEIAKVKKECEVMNVIPFSMLNLKYNHDQKEFLPSISVFSNGQNKKDFLTIEDYIYGGKFHQITFQNGFDPFKVKFLQVLIEQGYAIEKGELVYDRFSYLELSKEHRRERLKMGIEGGKTNDAYINLQSWFDGLYEKYQLKQTVMEI